MATPNMLTTLKMPATMTVTKGPVASSSIPPGKANNEVAAEAIVNALFKANI